MNKQYCRYCNNLVTGNGIWCNVRKKTLSEAYAKSKNQCQYFEFNEIDAFFENEQGYKPREKREPQEDKQVRFEL